MRKVYLYPILATALMLSGCGGGGGSSPAPTPIPSPPPPPPPPPPPATDFSAVQARMDASPIANMAVMVGDASGVLYTYEKGSFQTDDTILIASASKMVFGVTAWTAVEAGTLTATSQPQDHIGFWTGMAGDGRSDVTFDQLLGFMSGFNEPPGSHACIGDGGVSLSACVQQIYDGGLDSAAGSSFYYGPEHMQIAALMAANADGRDFGTLMRETVLDPVGISTATFYPAASGDNPIHSGAMRSSADDYAILLTAILNGDLISDRTGYLRDRIGNGFIGFRPGGVGAGSLDWHYGAGFWKECDELSYSAACDANPVISSPGAFGFTPWIDFGRGYWGIVAMQGTGGVGDPAALSVEIEQDIQPLIETALGL